MTALVLSLLAAVAGWTAMAAAAGRLIGAALTEADRATQE